MKRKLLPVIIVCVLNIFLFVIAVKFIADLPTPGTPDTASTEQTTSTTEEKPSVSIQNTTSATTNTTQTENSTAPDDPQNETQIPTEQGILPTETQSKTESDPRPTVLPEKETHPAENKELPLWKRLYAGYVTVYRNKYDHFTLVYVDDDDIPELYMYNSEQSELCAVRNDYMISQRLNGAGGGNYHEGSGNFMNVYPENGYLVMQVYHLTDYFMPTFYGREDKSVDPPLYYIEEYATPVSEEEFKSAVSEYIDTSNTTFLHENALTYDAIMEQLSN